MPIIDLIKYVIKYPSSAASKNFELMHLYHLYHESNVPLQQKIGFA